MAKKSAALSKSKSPESVWEFLNRPIGFNSVIEMLNRDIDFGPKREDPRKMPNLDAQAESLIDQAQRLAEIQGISLEAALEHFGIDIGSDEDADATDMRDNMLRSLDWEVTQADSGEVVDNAEEKQWIRRKDEIIALLREQFGSIERDILEELLALIKPEDTLLRDRLAFIGFCSFEEWAEAENSFQTSAGTFWQWLLASETRDVDLFVAILSTMPYAPLFTEDGHVFTEWLLNHNHIPYKMFKDAKAEAKLQGISICRVLAEEKFLGTKIHLELLSKFTGIPVWDKPIPKLTAKAIDALESEWAEMFNIVPLRKTKDTLDIASSCYLHPILIESLKKGKKGKVKVSLLTKEILEKQKAAFISKKEERQPVAMPTHGQEMRIRDIVASASAVNMVRQLFEGALDSRATDIHIEPTQTGVRVRFRIDGLLYDVMTMDHELAAEVVSRIKILADLDITERRRPQDGHIRINIHGNEYDMRIASVPTKYGEKIGIRLVYSGRVMKQMENLGLRKEDLNKIKSFIEMPHGMILATGPVGSGKTTTLYSCLNEINRDIYNVMSIEDPIEMGLPGANQVEVKYNLDFGFVEGLRALLRQDPDAILVGEIRDEETARIAIRASMTGLLVFSTLHTNDAPGAVTSLYNFNLAPHLIATSLVGVIAQRLLRRICPHCKMHYKPTQKEIKSIGFKPAEAKNIKAFYKGKGCSKCFQSGYLDRSGVFEVMDVTPTMREMIQEQRTEREIRERSIKDGMWTLARDGRLKVKTGETTTEEFLRVLRIF